jgi:DNA-binding PadR family transcriptional regulator
LAAADTVIVHMPPSAAVRPRSPLAMVLLALVFEEPMHPYRMQQLIKERGKDRVANVAQRNSVYQTIERLLRDGLIVVHATDRAERRPERTVYAITDAGTRTLHTWLAGMLSTPAREYLDFPAALAFLPLLEPDSVRRLLEVRADALAQRLAEIDLALAYDLPRLFLIEEEYRRTVIRAELDWVIALLDDLRSGRFTWSLDAVREYARVLAGGSCSCSNSDSCS